MNKQSLFHPGELAVQALANEADIAQRNGTVVSKHIIKGDQDIADLGANKPKTRIVKTGSTICEKKKKPRL